MRKKSLNFCTIIESRTRTTSLMRTLHYRYAIMAILEESTGVEPEGVTLSLFSKQAPPPLWHYSPFYFCGRLRTRTPYANVPLVFKTRPGTESPDNLPINKNYFCTPPRNRTVSVRSFGDLVLPISCDVYNGREDGARTHDRMLIRHTL